MILKGTIKPRRYKSAFRVLFVKDKETFLPAAEVSGPSNKEATVTRRDQVPSN